MKVHVSFNAEKSTKKATNNSKNHEKYEGKHFAKSDTKTIDLSVFRLFLVALLVILLFSSSIFVTIFAENGEAFKLDNLAKSSDKTSFSVLAKPKANVLEEIIIPSFSSTLSNAKSVVKVDDNKLTLYSLKLETKPEQFIFPCNFNRIESHYGYRDGYFHDGIDIASHGILNSDVIASKSGTVKYVKFDDFGYGYHLYIEHDDDTAALYAHMNDIVVAENQKVEQGQVIGKVGSTGDSDGPHLHFETYVNGTRTNPLKVLAN